MKKILVAVIFALVLITAFSPAYAGGKAPRVRYLSPRAPSAPIAQRFIPQVTNVYAMRIMPNVTAIPKAPLAARANYVALPAFVILNVPRFPVAQRANAAQRARPVTRFSPLVPKLPLAQTYVDP